MRSTTTVVSVSDLKARLSEYLRKVKAGETVIVTQRGHPIATMRPLNDEAMDQGLVELVESGLVRASHRPLPAGFWELERPSDPEGSVRAAILAEREEGR